ANWPWHGRADPPTARAPRSTRLVPGSWLPLHESNDSRAPQRRQATSGLLERMTIAKLASAKELRDGGRTVIERRTRFRRLSLLDGFCVSVRRRRTKDRLRTYLPNEARFLLLGRRFVPQVV